MDKFSGQEGAGLVFFFVVIFVIFWVFLALGFPGQQSQGDEGNSNKSQIFRQNGRTERGLCKTQTRRRWKKFSAVGSNKKWNFFSFFTPFFPFFSPFSRGAGIADPSEVRAQRGFPHPGNYCGHKVKPRARNHWKNPLFLELRHRKKKKKTKKKNLWQQLSLLRNASKIASENKPELFQTTSPEGVKKNKNGGEKKEKKSHFCQRKTTKVNSQQLKFNLPDFPCSVITSVMAALKSCNNNFPLFH